MKIQLTSTEHAHAKEQVRLQVEGIRADGYGVEITEDFGAFAMARLTGAEESIEMLIDPCNILKSSVEGDEMTETEQREFDETVRKGVEQFAKAGR